MLGKIEIIGDWQKVICMWRLLISVKNIWDGSSKQLNINFFIYSTLLVALNFKSKNFRDLIEPLYFTKGDRKAQREKYFLLVYSEEKKLILIFPYL